MSTIPQLDQLRKRLGELNLQKARYGFSADPHITMEADDLNTVVHQMDLIEISRQNLSHLLKQREHFGPNTPTHIINQINSTRAEIVRLRQVCARLGQNVPSHPVDDDEPEQPLPPIRETPSATPTDIHAKLDQIQRLLNEIRAALS